jgi:nitrite reductase/ring-hydroxylating ferredoxin subunit
MSQYVCKIEEIDENGKEIRLMAGQVPSYVMLFLHAGTIRAYFNACPHQGRPLNWGPDQFLFSPERHLVCAQHGATFLLESGECISGPCRGARLRRLAIRLKGDSVWLDPELAPEQAPDHA